MTDQQQEQRRARARRRARTPRQKKLHAKWVREKVRERREAWIDSQGRVCTRCKCKQPYPYPQRFWHIDHRDPKTKRYEISHCWFRRKEIREAELAKCQLLCYKCHLFKSVRDGSHAHLWMYVVQAEFDFVEDLNREPGEETISTAYDVMVREEFEEANGSESETTEGSSGSNVPF